MKIARLLISLLALLTASGVHADAFKCKAADGKIVISSQACQPGSRTEAVQASETISPEQQLQAETSLERQRQALAEREAARAAARQSEHETERRLATEETLRQNQCLQHAQSEPDTQVRASLIAACTGAPPPSVIVQEPAYLPYYPNHRPYVAHRAHGQRNRATEPEAGKAAPGPFDRPDKFRVTPKSPSPRKEPVNSPGAR